MTTAYRKIVWSSRKASSRMWLTFVVSLMYSLSLASLPVDVFSDRSNYLMYAQDSWVIFLQRWSVGWVALLLSEPLWLLFNAFLSTFLQPEDVVRATILCSSSIVAWFVTRNFANSPWKAVLVLLFPLVIRYHITALRNGLALALFLAGWFSAGFWKRWLLLSLSPFIHVSYFIVLALLAVAHLSTRLRLAQDLRILTFVLSSLLLTWNIRFLASALGARQAQEYAFAAVDFSGLGILFWASILCLMWLEGSQFMRQHNFETGCVVFYLVGVWFVDVAARAFESMSLVVLLAGMQLTGWRRVAFVALLVAYLLVYVLLNHQKPWLGFGVG